MISKRNLLALFIIELCTLASCQKEEPKPQPVHVSSVSISSENLKLTEGESQTLTATVSPSNADNKTVIWSSSDASIASINGGKVTAIKAGTATVTAKSDDGGKTASCKVTVIPKSISVESISLDRTKISMLKDDEITLVATISPADATNKNVIWSSSDTQVVTVDGGKVKAIKEGNAKITAKSEDGGKIAECQVSVLSTQCLIFSTVSGENALIITNIQSNLEYSTDLVNWQNCVEKTPMRFGNGTKLFLRGHGNNCGSGEICHFEFSNDAEVSCVGNIMTLLDYENPGNAITRISCFYHLFQDCKSLVQAPELPATTLDDKCYEAMFIQCTSLTTAPVLPATTLADYCYSYMFSGCTSLTTAPELPARTLAVSCYSYMFNLCTSLTTAPVLPATALAAYCYRGLFDRCTSLTTAPELPATTLAAYCYLDMFSGCTSLTTAPVLPATALADHCYLEMFRGCTSLTTAPELPATTLADHCYDNMFRGCTSLTTAPELPARTLAVSCYLKMFSFCSSLTTAPVLPATTLAAGCYLEMFSGCTSLTTAPELPATTLADSCYRQMFDHCTSLTTAPELPATQLAGACYQSMFFGCESLNYIKAMFIEAEYSATNSWLAGAPPTGTFVKNKAASWSNNGIIPIGWTVQYAEK